MPPFFGRSDASFCRYHAGMHIFHRSILDPCLHFFSRSAALTFVWRSSVEGGQLVIYRGLTFQSLSILHQVTSYHVYATPKNVRQGPPQLFLSHVPSERDRQYGYHHAPVHVTSAQIHPPEKGKRDGNKKYNRSIAHSSPSLAVSPCTGATHPR